MAETPAPQPPAPQPPAPQPPAPQPPAPQGGKRRIRPGGRNITEA
ncbi:MAG: hypothetical protein V7K90_18765 [Nostoc sp.]